MTTIAVPKPVKTRTAIKLSKDAFLKLSSGYPETIIYPDSDGKPMADSTLHFDKMVFLKDNFELLYRDEPYIFVAGDLFWYPVEGDNRIRQAPDVMIAFGPKKGDRGSYRQWEEQNIPPQIAFEIISHRTITKEMRDKRNFYQRYGVQEYYEYDPQRGTLEGWLNQDGQFQAIDSMIGWKSPLLGVSFAVDGKDIQVYKPDGTRFLTFRERYHARVEAEKHVKQEEQARLEANKQIIERKRAREAKWDSKKAEELMAKVKASIREAEAELEAMGNNDNT